MKMIAPIAQRLRLDGVEVVILALTTASSFLKQVGIPHSQLKDYVSRFPEAENIRRTGARLASGLAPNPDVDPMETEAYLGLGYWSLSKRHGDLEAERRYADKGRYAFEPDAAVEVLLDEIRPDFVLATTSPRFEESFLRCAKKRGLQNGCLVNIYNSVLFSSKVPAMSFVDVFFVPGDFEAIKMSENGIVRDRIMVTGNPAFEAHNEQTFKEEGRKLRSQFFPEKKVVILFAKASVHTRFAAFDDLIEECLYQLVGHHPHVGLIIRNHPNDPTRRRDVAGVLYSRLDETIAGVIHASDIVVSQLSTVGIESKFIGKKVLQCAHSLEDLKIINYEEIGVGKSAIGIESFLAKLDPWLEVSHSSKESAVTFQSSNLIAAYIKNVFEKN
ncbi:MAG: hypothetical protein ACLGG7_04255 [Bacteriovoracia bacterium]